MIPYNSKLNQRDLQVLQWQLKGTTDAVSGIFEKCNFGFPQIILLSPIVNDLIDY